MPRPVDNPPNPWLSEHVEWLGPAPPAQLEVFEEEAASILSENDSPDVGFRFSVNPYRGCFHGCAYCYARPTHPYLGFGAGTDFERKIVVKVNAPELLRAAFARRSWRREIVVFSGNTDCYQPLEAAYRLSRGMLEACREAGNPAAVVTKSALVRRDADLLAAIPGARVFLSVPFADDRTARALEPFAPAPSVRFETMRALARAGVPVGVAVAPIIPGLNESHIPHILRRAAECGATRAFHVLLRLPAEVREVFTSRLKEAFPLRARKVLAALRETRGGALYRSHFGERMRGVGPRWEAFEALFRVWCARLGLDSGGGEAPESLRAPGAAQLPLPGFDDCS